MKKRSLYASEIAYISWYKTHTWPISNWSIHFTGHIMTSIGTLFTFCYQDVFIINGIIEIFFDKWDNFKKPCLNDKHYLWRGLRLWTLRVVCTIWKLQFLNWFSITYLVLHVLHQWIMMAIMRNAFNYYFFRKRSFLEM